MYTRLGNPNQRALEFWGRPWRRVRMPTSAPPAWPPSWPCSHRGLSAAELHELGITQGTIRLSVGLEDLEDVMRDLDRGLAAGA